MANDFFGNLEAQERFITRRILERVNYHCRGTRAMAEVRHEVRPGLLSAYADGLVDELHSFIWQEDLQSETATLEIETPADWWQHFKQAWFTPAMLKRWPVVMAKHKKTWLFKTCAKYPALEHLHPMKDFGPFRYVIVRKEIT